MAAHRFKSDFLRTFVERGAYYDCSAPEDLDALFQKERVTAYIGFDCTASSMHIGNLVQLMTLRRLQQAGHRPILLMGGGTTKAGDPSGKDETRLILTPQKIEENKQSMVAGVRHLLKFGDGPTDALMVDNAEWLDKLEYISFLREVGKHFSVNRMLTMDSVKLRLDREQPLSFLEFNYSLMQAYDFVELYTRYGCRLQSSGSDQWGNVVSGIELGRRMENVQLFGLTTPLITTSSGA
ncbi:MAG TPA: tyrosine--tRNA ligase, partial [Rhizomicrobium sp.]